MMKGREDNYLRTLPFVFLKAKPSNKSNEARGIDLPVSEDPLPTVVKINKVGSNLSRDTHLTEVSRETTDDN